MSTTDFSPVTMAECLSHFATLHPDAVALTIVDKKGDTPYTYRNLEQRSRALAAGLQQQAGSSVVGERALLLMDTGVDYVAAFFACLYAGVVAVPIFPPESVRKQHLQRLKIVADDAEARWLLTSSAIAKALDGSMQDISDAETVLVDETDSVLEKAYQPWAATSEDLAFLQYTSGSTSAPKGVMVNHGNLMSNEAALQAVAKTHAQDVFVSWLPLFHDMGLIFGLLHPLYCGSHVLLMSPRYFLERPDRWLGAIDKYKGTVSGGPDFAYRMCVERIRNSESKQWDLSRWRLAFSGAEPIRVDTLDDFVSQFETSRFNPQSITACYGLAEATVLVSATKTQSGLMVLPLSAKDLAKNIVRKATKKDQSSMQVACGYVALGHELLIVDPDSLDKKQSAAVGEIWVSGPSITQGYWKNPEATAQAFVEKDGKRWLRTGDMGFIHKRQLYVSGRCKDLIIIRGQNFYPQDIEVALESELEWVRRGRVAAFATDLNGSEGIGLALEVSKSIRSLATPEGLVEQLNEVVSRLCMEPVSVVLLLESGSLPKTSSGKLQRSACRTGWQQQTLNTYAVYEGGEFLKKPDGEAIDNKTNRENSDLPQSDVEVVLAQVWSDILKIDHVSRFDNFFALGGDSVLILKVVSLAAERGLSVSAKQLFSSDNLTELASLIKNNETTKNRIIIPALTPEQRQNELVLSHAQQRQWFFNQLEPDSSAYHISGAVNLSGPINVESVRSGFQALINRHESLRTIFQNHDQDNTAIQIVVPELLLDIPCVDLQSVAEPEQAALAYARDLAGKPFDLQEGPLLRVAILHWGSNEYLLTVAMHHIIADGWSMQIIIDEFVEQYQAILQGSESRLSALAIQYADYARWQNDWLEAGNAASQLDYWTSILGDEHPALSLPSDHPRTAVTAYQAKKHSFVLPDSLTHSIQYLARSRSMTPYMVLLSAFQILLYRYTDQEKIRVGVPVANRNRVETENLVGFFVNTLVMPAELTGKICLEQFLDQTKAMAAGAQDNQDLPFDTLIEALQLERSLQNSPLFQVMFNHQRKDERALRQLPDITVGKTQLLVNAAQFELTLDTEESHNGEFSAYFTYARELFEAETISRMAGHYVAILEALTTDLSLKIEDISLFSEAEKQQLQTWGVNHLPASSTQWVHQSVEEFARLQPDAKAVTEGKYSLTFSELNQRANQLARYLQEQGIKPEQIVGVALPRSVDLIVCYLGVLKSGGAYVPLDLSYPSQRLAYMMKDSGMCCVLTTHTADSLLPEVKQVQRFSFESINLSRFYDDNIFVPLHAEHPAYVIYTSGSTGQPKGVMVAHGAIAMHCKALGEQYEKDTNSRSLIFMSFSFDGAHECWLTSMTHGGQIIMRGEELWTVEQAYDALHDHAITDVVFPPVFMRELADWVEVKGNPPAIKTYCFGGDAMSKESFDRIKVALGPEQFINGYGPTETVVTPLLWRVAPDQSFEEGYAPIGRLVGERCAYILDKNLKPVPVGVPGELYLGGKQGLARGYLRRFGLTAERFIPNPFSDDGERLYRTGDLVGWRKEGAVDYLGRLDSQIKIRGFRIEPGEIEAQIREQSEVFDTVVVAVEGASGVRLAAYWVKISDAIMNNDVLKSRLQEVLPDYMIPSAYVELPELPVNANGKVDRKALPEPTFNRSIGYEAPQGEIEQVLAVIWMSVLKVEKIGRHDNFFELGGHSLLALKIVALLSQQQGLSLPVKYLFERVTIASLAAHIECTPSLGWNKNYSNFVSMDALFDELEA